LQISLTEVKHGLRYAGIGALVGLGAGLASVDIHIAATMGIQSVNVAAIAINTGFNTSEAGAGDQQKGPDYVFVMGQNYIDHTVEQNGTNSIYLMINGAKQLITQVDLKVKSNRQLVADVVGFFANEVGVNLRVYGGKGRSGLNENPDKTSEENPAFTEGPDVWVNNHGNKISSQLSNVYAMEVVLGHEKGHQDFWDFANNKPRTPENAVTHSKIYLNEIKNPLFKKTPAKFQTSQVAQLAKKILLAIDNGLGGQDLIEDFNKNNGLGYTMILSGDAGICTNCKIIIRQNGKLITTVDLPEKDDE